MKIKEIIKAIQGFFQLRKIEVMNLETIRKIWVWIGGILLAINVSWMPEWIVNLFGPEGTDAVFSVIGAILALLQFLPFRTGANKPEALKASDRAKASYWLPWTAA